MSVNPYFPHLSRRHLSRVEPFLIAKSLKPRLHYLIHRHLVQRKRARLSTIGVRVPVKVDLRLTLQIEDPTEDRRIGGEIVENEMSHECEGFY